MTSVSDPKAELERLLTGHARSTMGALPDVEVRLERPREAAHGDYATNVALAGARAEKRPPRAIAQAFCESATADPAVRALVEAIEIAGPGFVNLRLTPAARQSVVARILRERGAYGRTNRLAGERIMVEFVSANPTGPLHVGHGRQAALGDAISSLLESQGAQVTREFYYNDAGQQIENLAVSVRARAKELLGESGAFPEDGYRGEYIRELAQRWLDEVGHDLSDIDAIRRFAVAELRKEQDRDLQAFGVRFDNYYLESSLYTDGRVEATVERLRASGHAYEGEGALWLRTTGFGDDKDRVMRKTDGSYTYFVPDVAYHITKWERRFSRAINVQGSDHHSTITRVRAGLQAASSTWPKPIPAGYPDYVLHKMVTVMKGGEEVRISKRAGSYVTLRDLIDEVGRDATRFFLVSRKADSEFTFDVDLAKSQSEDNPVYYVQYAHARICSVLSQSGEDVSTLPGTDLSPLTSAREMSLLNRLGEYPEILDIAARELAPHQVAFYLRELAGEFHSYYNAERVLVDDTSVRRARLALFLAVRQVLQNGLRLLGVGAPEKM
ncbi:MAG: arginine--tRNA ligase [Burkholderiales bacterium]|nr:arginine--tRNA ligase [Burkholderiales bacterium]